ncbi:MAG: hypothetical protein AAF581_17430 [Planctomycetota bacterium]
MAAYSVIPNAQYGRGFHLELARQRVAQLTEVTRDEFEIHVGDARYRIDTASFSGTRFRLLDENSRVLATAERPDAISPSYEVLANGRKICEIQPVSTFGRKHHVLIDQNIVGLIDPDDITTRTATAQLPDDVELPLCCFLVWLVQQRVR